MRKNDFALLGILCPLFLVFTGCGEKLPDGMPPLYPATLLITQEGKPLPGAMTGLTSAEGSHTWTSGGTTDAEGKLVVFTHGKYRGIPAGKYKVTVDCIAADVPRPESMTEEESTKFNKEHPSFRTVPLKYTEKDKTPFSIEVANGKNTFTLDIPEKKVKLSLGAAP
ncbi:MAG: hypothetical protein LBN39_00070 [Planctomycetaceae bacterium]|jgi:hypothetical protein|nr:hypothetical protein [Planctomycetaceae bacterium]